MEELPIDEVLKLINQESNPTIAFQKIIDLGRETLPSTIWDSFTKMNIEADVISAKDWIQTALSNFPETTGIYLGLDTLNMENGKGSNAEMGLSSICNPEELSSDWIYEGETSPEMHLIKGLFQVSDAFQNEEKYSSNERSFAEYLIFLAYNGSVFREVLPNVESKNDFLAIWGFHDGDMFPLVTQRSGIKSITTRWISINKTSNMLS